MGTKKTETEKSQVPADGPAPSNHDNLRLIAFIRDFLIMYQIFFLISFFHKSNIQLCHSCVWCLLLHCLKSWFSESISFPNLLVFEFTLKVYTEESC